MMENYKKGWQVEKQIRELLPHHGRSKHWKPEWIAEADEWLSKVGVTMALKNILTLTLGDIEIIFTSAEYHRSFSMTWEMADSRDTSFENVYNHLNFENLPLDIWATLFSRIHGIVEIYLQEHSNRHSKIYIDQCMWYIKPNHWHPSIIPMLVYPKEAEQIDTSVGKWFTLKKHKYTTKLEVSMEIKKRIILYTFSSYPMRYFVATNDQKLFLKEFIDNLCINFKNGNDDTRCAGNRFTVTIVEEKSKLCKICCRLYDGRENFEKNPFLVKCLLLTIKELEPLLMSTNSTSREEKFLQQQTTIGSWIASLDASKNILIDLLGNDVTKLIIDYCLIDELWLSKFIIVKK